MNNTEALETLVGSKILSVKLSGGIFPWKVEITTKDGKTITIRIYACIKLLIEVKGE